MESICVTFRYDIALLHLSSEASLNRYVQLGPLPPVEQILPHDNLCYIIGWGLTSSESHLVTHTLMSHVALPHTCAWQNHRGLGKPEPKCSYGKVVAVMAGCYQMALP